MDIQTLSIKKRRVMTYFIEAARQLMSSEGIQALSIRGIAEIAGYNSATLYNYFEDLQHLTLFASMSYLRDYVSALSGKLKPPMNSLERYRLIYETFDYFAFRSPEIFYNMFFGRQRSKLPEVTVQYYTLFPDELKEHSPAVRKMLLQGDMYLRDKPIVEELVRDGFVKPENAVHLAAIVPRLNQTYLYELANGECIDPEEQHRRFIAAFDYLLETAK
ncbi:TetR/AcrR family transcriptional regulator [Cloacibacillus porcorum]